MNDRLNKTINHPLHKHFGISDIKSREGQGSLSFSVNDHLVNPAGALHGGVIYAVCDVCAYAGLLSLLDEDKEAVTHDIHVSVLRAAKHGDQVIMTSSVTKLGKRLCFISVSAKVEDHLIATATVTKSIIDLTV